MHITTIKYGRTVKHTDDPKCFEFDRLDVEVILAPSQSAEDAFADLRQYVDAELEKIKAGTNGKPAKKAEKKPDPTASASQSTASTASASGSTETTRPAETTTSSAEKPKATKAKGKGSKKAESQAKVAIAQTPDHKKELQFAIDSENLDELLERFNNVSKLRDQFGDQWEAAVTQLAGRYRKLNSLDADPEVCDQLVKAFKRERQKIEELKAAA